MTSITVVIMRHHTEGYLGACRRRPRCDASQLIHCSSGPTKKLLPNQTRENLLGRSWNISSVRTCHPFPHVHLRPPFEFWTPTSRRRRRGNFGPPAIHRF